MSAYTHRSNHYMNFNKLLKDFEVPKAVPYEGWPMGPVHRDPNVDEVPYEFKVSQKSYADKIQSRRATLGPEWVDHMHTVHKWPVISLSVFGDVVGITRDVPVPVSDLVCVKQLVCSGNVDSAALTEIISKLPSLRSLYTENTDVLIEQDSGISALSFRWARNVQIRSALKLSLCRLEIYNINTKESLTYILDNLPSTLYSLRLECPFTGQIQSLGNIGNLNLKSFTLSSYSANVEYTELVKLKWSCMEMVRLPISIMGYTGPTYTYIGSGLMAEDPQPLIHLAMIYPHVNIGSVFPIDVTRAQLIRDTESVEIDSDLL